MSNRRRSQPGRQLGPVIDLTSPPASRAAIPDPAQASTSAQSEQAPSSAAPADRTRLTAAQAPPVGPLKASPYDDLIVRLMIAIQPVLAEHQKSVENSIAALARDIADTRTEARDQSAQIATLLETSHRAQKATTKAIAQRVEKLDKLIGTTQGVGGDKAVMERLDGIEFAVEELLERAKDIDAPKVATVRHEAATSPMKELEPLVPERIHTDVDPIAPGKPATHTSSHTTSSAGTSMDYGSPMRDLSDPFTIVADGMDGDQFGPSPNSQRPRRVMQDTQVNSLYSMEASFSYMPFQTTPLVPVNWSDWAHKGKGRPQHKLPMEFFHPNTSPRVNQLFKLLPEISDPPAEGTMDSLRLSVLGSSMARPRSPTPEPAAPYFHCPSVSPFPSPAHTASPAHAATPATSSSSAPSLSLIVPSSSSSVVSTPVLVEETLLEPLQPDDATPLSASHFEPSGLVSLRPRVGTSPVSTSEINDEESVSRLVTQTSSYGSSSSPLSALSSLSPTPPPAFSLLPETADGKHFLLTSQSLYDGKEMKVQARLRIKDPSSKAASSAATRVRKRKVKGEDQAPSLSEPPVKRARGPQKSKAGGRGKLVPPGPASTSRTKRNRKSAAGLNDVTWPDRPDNGIRAEVGRQADSGTSGDGSDAVSLQTRVPTPESSVRTPGTPGTFRMSPDTPPARLTLASTPRYSAICQLWYHYGCVGIVPGDIRMEPSELFICPPCTTTDQPRRPGIRGRENECARPDCMDDAEPDLFFVEKLVGRKPGSGGFKYLVKWDYYPFSACTWEGEDAMVDPRRLIANFEEAAAAEGLALDPMSVVLLQEAAEHGWTESMGPS